MEENKKLVVAALVILFGSNATGIINAFNPDFRADAFTSLDAAKMKAELKKEIQDCRRDDEANMDILREKITINEQNIIHLWKRMP